MSGAGGIEPIPAHPLPELDLDLEPLGEGFRITLAQADFIPTTLIPTALTQPAFRSPASTPSLPAGVSDVVTAHVPTTQMTAAQTADTHIPVTEAARSPPPDLMRPDRALASTTTRAAALPGPHEATSGQVAAPPPSAPQPAAKPLPDAAPLQTLVHASHPAAETAHPALPASAPPGATASADPGLLAPRRADPDGHTQAAAHLLQGANVTGFALQTLILPQIAFLQAGILQAGNPKRDAPILRRALARQPAMHLEPFDAGGVTGRRVSYTDRRPVPIDIAPHRAQARCWRLDDTEALILAGDHDHEQEAGRAVALHARLLDGAAPVTLDEGEGFSTWEGSPLWLALACIPKPAALGILLSETSPARLSVLRLSQDTWLVERSGRPSRILDATSSSPPSPLGLDDAVGKPAFVSASDPAGLRHAEALAALHRFAARLTRLPDAEAAARAICNAAAAAAPAREFATRDDLLTAARAGDASLPARLFSFGRTVLEALVGGSFDGIDGIAGIALAAAPGRLQDTRALQEDR